MNADQFYKEIKSLKPRLEDFSDYSIDFAQGYINDMRIAPMENPYEAMPNDPVLDLIGRYDVSSLCIQIFEFFNPDDVGENEKYIYFGNKEGSLLAIEKNNRSDCRDGSRRRINNLLYGKGSVKFP